MQNGDKGLPRICLVRRSHMLKAFELHGVCQLMKMLITL